MLIFNGSSELAFPLTYTREICLFSRQIVFGLGTERIDDAAEHLNATRKRMETIRSKLAEMQVATGSAQQPDKAANDDGSSVQESKQEEEQTTQKEQEEAEEARTRKERCIRAFNLNPKKGITQIKESCVDVGDGKKTVAASLPQVYPSLAQFLFSETASLNKVKLGEWLGDAADENARTLAAFSRAVTTFSTFSVDVVKLAQAGHVAPAAGLALGTNVLSIGAAAAGLSLGASPATARALASRPALRRLLLPSPAPSSGAPPLGKAVPGGPRPPL